MGVSVLGMRVQLLGMSDLGDVRVGVGVVGPTGPVSVSVLRPEDVCVAPDGVVDSPDLGASLMSAVLLEDVPGVRESSPEPLES